MQRQHGGAVRVGGVTQVVGGALVEVAHDVTCADERQGVITVALDLPGGTREITMHAEFIKLGTFGGQPQAD